MGKPEDRPAPGNRKACPCEVYHGQQNMKAVQQVKGVANLYLTWISNFSCAPDSFMLHYVRWLMGQKPYLILEIDSHTADAGLDTRVEAFLDIVES